MKNMGTPMSGKTRRNMIKRIQARVQSGQMKERDGEVYVGALLTKLYPGVTRVMAYGFHPTK